MARRSLLALALLAPATADAGPLVRVGAVKSVAASDGDRRVAYVPRGGRHIAVVDTVTGRRHRVRRPRGCTLNALRGARLHLACGTKERAISATTGRMLRLRGIRAVNRRMAACAADRGCSADVAARGRHWIAVQWHRADVNPTEVTVDFTNVATGRVRALSESASEAEDVDHPRLVRRLCAPLRRTPVPDGAGGPAAFQPFAYERPYGLSVRVDGFSVQRCGRRAPVLARGRDARALQLTRRHALWVTRDRTGRQRLHAQNVASGRRASWVTEHPLGRLTVPAFVVTARWLYVTDFRGLEERRLVLYRGALP